MTSLSFYFQKLFKKYFYFIVLGGIIVIQWDYFLQK